MLRLAGAVEIGPLDGRKRPTPVLTMLVARVHQSVGKLPLVNPWV